MAWHVAIVCTLSVGTVATAVHVLSPLVCWSAGIWADVPHGIHDSDCVCGECDYGNIKASCMCLHTPESGTECAFVNRLLMIWDTLIASSNN